MTTFTYDTPSRMGWLARAEAWMDDKGKPAWIAAMVLGFIAFWPIGLALLAYMIWGKNMFCSARSGGNGGGRCGRKVTTSHSTGNSAFDSYRNETLRRLEDEQQNFEAFLQRLRDARDKAEFDQFMDERARAAAHSYETQDDDGGVGDTRDDVQRKPV